MFEPRKFLVRIGDRFFAGFDDNKEPLVVAAPSVSDHLTYAKADDTAQYLIGKGFLDVCVTDVAGAYADLKTIERVLAPGRGSSSGG